MVPIVIDLSHHVWDGNPHLDFAAAKTAGIVGVIYKATEGATYQDPKFIKTKAAVESADLLWGVFHFATAAPPADQFRNFWDTAQPDNNTLVALDFEHNDPHPTNTTSPTIARDILKRMEDKLGRRPHLYTGAFMYDCFGSHAQVDLADYRCWWAAYTSTPKVHPTWAEYWMWQYTDGQHGPGQKSVAGIGPCDCNFYPHDVAQLKSEWV